jgi:two-component system, OmpR family, sensor histidine kinase CiaH
VNRRLGRVRALSFRTALLSVGIVAVAFAVISVVLDMWVDQTLTSQVDRRLTTELQRVESDPSLPSPPADFSQDATSRFGPPLLAWSRSESDGWTSTDQYVPAPPAGVTSTPATMEVGGVEMRVVGAQVGSNYVVVAQSMASITSAQGTIVWAELVVGSVLLLVTFLGALAVGRRVGAPIELARQRQMEFTADASHELRTPLAVIEAQTSLALAHPRDPEWYRQAFQRVGSESKRIRRLVEDLLWLARVDASGRLPHPEPVDLGVLAAQAVDRFSGVAEARGQTVTLHVGPGSHLINGSGEWLDRLLGVVIDNACKYTPESGTVRVTVSNDGHRVRLAVDDSGPGIPEAERSRVLNRFHRANDLPGGSGLGLAIADAVVKATHGRWEIGGSPLGGASMAVAWARTMPHGREVARTAGEMQQPQPS